jgi:hypothetical protein
MSNSTLNNFIRRNPDLNKYIVTRNYVETPRCNEQTLLELDYLSSSSKIYEDSKNRFSLSNSNSENEINLIRYDYLNRLTDELLQLIRDSDFEYGFDSPIDYFIKKQMQQNASVTKEWLTSVFNQNFRNVEITTGILRTIAHMSYDEIAPQGILMALASFSHKNSEVRECGIRTCENWAHPECLEILKNVTVPEKWLQNYISQVISDLEEDLA